MGEFGRPPGIQLPEAISSDYDNEMPVDRFLRPVFDALWNAFGFARCLNYDDTGTWSPQR